VTRLDWAQSAIRDLDQITNYLDAEAPGVGSRVFAAIERHTGLPYDFPHLGELLPELGLRKLVVEGFPYLLLDNVTGATVTIIRIQHSAEDWRPR
jgi:plasmid stabilization system protein ParE